MKKSALEKRVAELENTIRMMQIVIDSLERDKQDKPVLYRDSKPEIPKPWRQPRPFFNHDTGSPFDRYLPSLPEPQYVTCRANGVCS